MAYREYHVFHRLLLPRPIHQIALFRDDLIRKKKDDLMSYPLFGYLRTIYTSKAGNCRTSSPSGKTKLVRNCLSLSRSKAYFLRRQSYRLTASSASSLPSVQDVGVTTLVSVLDLDNTVLFPSSRLNLKDRGNSLKMRPFLRSSNRDQHAYSVRSDRVVCYF